MNFYPYKQDTISMVQNNIPINNMYDQLDLAPYSPLFSKETHILLAQAHMELANSMKNTILSISIENMSNTISQDMFDQAHENVMEHFKSKKKMREENAIFNKMSTDAKIDYIYDRYVKKFKALPDNNKAQQMTKEEYITQMEKNKSYRQQQKLKPAPNAQAKGKIQEETIDFDTSVMKK